MRSVGSFRRGPRLHEREAGWRRPPMRRGGGAMGRCRRDLRIHVLRSRHARIRVCATPTKARTYKCSPKFQGRWAVVARYAGAVCTRKQVGEVHRCALEVARWEDLVEIYASVCFEVDQTRPDLLIRRGASIFAGPGSRLFNKRTLTTGGGN